MNHPSHRPPPIYGDGSQVITLKMTFGLRQVVQAHLEIQTILALIEANDPAVLKKGLDGITEVAIHEGQLIVHRTVGVYPPVTKMSITHAAAVALGRTLGWLEAKGFNVYNFIYRITKVEDYLPVVDKLLSADA